MSRVLAKIHIADDSLLDIELVKELVARAGIVCTWESSRDGEDILNVLTGDATRVSSDLPHVIILDINLPKRDGFEILRLLKSDPRLSDIPVIMLTGSDLARDVQRAKTLGCAGYIVKPLTAERFLDLLTRLPRIVAEVEHGVTYLCIQPTSSMRM